MEDIYVKPGNQERGWNDPPQFSYGLQTALGGPKKTLLNKRVPPPQLTAGASNPGTSQSPLTPPTNPLAPPPCSMNTPPRLCLASAPPLGGMMATPPPACPASERSDSADGQSQSEPSIDDVIGALSGALTACRPTVKRQVCDDMAKRLKVLEDMWRSGRLSLPVRRRMTTLAQEMERGRWDAADEVHRGLMVDHVTEVSQWMVGVKRLIAETRNLSPDVPHTEEPQPQH